MQPPPRRKLGLNKALLGDDGGQESLNKALFLGGGGIGGVPFNSHDVYPPVTGL